MSHQIIRTALEWFKASGDRTKERLDKLVWHWGEQYGYSPAAIVRFCDDAWDDYKASI